MININKFGLSIALGCFDGMHLGHKKIILDAKEYADKHNLYSSVLLLDFESDDEIRYLMSLKDKIEFLESIKINKIVIENFYKIRNLSAKDFIEKILIKKLNVRSVFVGKDYTFGFNKTGNVDLLKEYEKIGIFKVEEEEFVMDGDTKISSSNIKKYIQAGRIKEANKNLDSYYKIKAQIIKGKNIGSKMLLPTANMSYNLKYIIPLDGVYATDIKINGRLYKSITSIGYNKTFDAKDKSIETLIFDFDDNIYGEYVSLFFKERIRDMIKFKSKEELLDRIKEDVIIAKSL